jgi:hypothetical protein
MNPDRTAYRVFDLTTFTAHADDYSSDPIGRTRIQVIPATNQALREETAACWATPADVDNVGIVAAQLVTSFRSVQHHVHVEIPEPFPDQPPHVGPVQSTEPATQWWDRDGSDL